MIGDYFLGKEPHLHNLENHSDVLTCFVVVVVVYCSFLDKANHFSPERATS